MVVQELEIVMQQKITQIEKKPYFFIHAYDTTTSISAMKFQYIQSVKFIPLEKKDFAYICISINSSSERVPSGIA